jgi:hypothetical protein
MNEMPPENESREVRELIEELHRILLRLERMHPRRRRVVQHLEAAIKCLKDPREHFRPDELNSANDG